MLFSKEECKWCFSFRNLRIVVDTMFFHLPLKQDAYHIYLSKRTKCICNKHISFKGCVDLKNLFMFWFIYCNPQPNVLRTNFDLGFINNISIYLYSFARYFLWFISLNPFQNGYMTSINKYSQGLCSISIRETQKVKI